MKLCMFTPIELDLERGWPGKLDGDRVIQVAAQTLQAFFTGGGMAREHAVYPLAEVRFLVPVLRPPAIRIFEGSDFHFGNPTSLYGPDEDVPVPVEQIEAVLRPAAVIGVIEQIGGFTVMNDWHAPELEGAKAYDFATSLGPVVVTPDEFDGGEGEMVARVNGEERSRGNLRDLNWPWERLLEQAARNTHLVAGDVIGSGTVGTGCILELGDGRWLRPGDEVELEVEGLGVLRNRIAPPIEG